MTFLELNLWGKNNIGMNFIFVDFINVTDVKFARDSREFTHG